MIKGEVAHNRNNRLGQVHGKLTVLSLDNCKDKSGSRLYWLCRCECGRVKTVRGSQLHSNSSCGSCTQIRNLTGHEYGSLTVLSYQYSKNKEPFWLCRCACGREVIKGRSYLRSNRIIKKSCGCLPLEGKRSFRGVTSTPFYKRLANVYRGMVSRCYDVDHISYHNYGGRGITVCSLWLDNPILFVQFALNNGWKGGLHLDRIDVNGNYEPSNCRFVTQKENSRNTRSNHYVEFNGKTVSVSQAVEEAGNIVSYKTAITRINKLGWSVHRAVTTPARKNQYE